ncbi:restriction endonuclease subunit S [Salinibacter ruber]|nr:restriction endonuclease subunit S [Salinibacter ruber]
MSDEPDFEMEVVRNDELDSAGSDSNSETPSHRGEGEADDSDSIAADSDSREQGGEMGRSGRSSGEDDGNQEVFGLGRVPDDWKIRSLPKVAVIEMGSSPPSATYNEEGEGLPFYQGNADFGHMKPKVSTWCSDPVKTADRDDVLISIRAPVGDLNIADEHCCIGRGLAALRPNGVNGLYLYYGLAQRSRWLARLASGSTFKSVSSADLEKVDLPVPPLPEQRKIASVLYAVDQAIQKTEAIIEQAQRVSRGLIEKLTMWGIGHSEFKKIDVTPKFLDVEVPRKWEKVSYAEVTENITYGFTNPMPESDYGRWRITAKDIREGKIHYDEAGKTTEEAYRERLTGKSRPEVGNVLVTKDGTLGRVGVVDRQGICINQSVASIRPKKEKITSEYLALTIKSPLVKKLIKSHNPQTTIGHIKISELAEWEFPLPPVEEQNEIVRIVDSVREKIQNERNKKQRLQRLKKGLMQDLLTGEVRTADRAIEVLEEVQAHG